MNRAKKYGLKDDSVHKPKQLHNIEATQVKSKERKIIN